MDLALNNLQGLICRNTQQTKPNQEYLHAIKERKQSASEEIMAFIWLFFFFFAGPSYWGLLNPEWRMCSEGKQQSPIDIQPKYMLFDPNLKHVVVNKIKVSDFNRTLKSSEDDKITRFYAQ